MIDDTEIIQGKHNGKKVWICALSYISFGNKPLRHTKPTKVMVVETGGVYWDQKVNFKVLKKNGECSTKKIKMYPNVDSYSNYPVTVCETLEECQEQYGLLCKEAIVGMTRFKSNIENEIEKHRSNIPKNKTEDLKVVSFYNIIEVDETTFEVFDKYCKFVFMTNDYVTAQMIIKQL